MNVVRIAVLDAPMQFFHSCLCILFGIRMQRADKDRYAASMRKEDIKVIN